MTKDNFSMTLPFIAFFKNFLLFYRNNVMHVCESLKNLIKRFFLHFLLLVPIISPKTTGNTCMACITMAMQIR